MPDLHTLWHGPWRPLDVEKATQGEPASVERPPLAVRLPESVPEGVEWHEGRWLLHPDGDPSPYTMLIASEQAELLHIGQAVKVLGETGWRLSRWNDAILHKPMWELVDGDGTPIVAREPSLLAALAAALHRLADERNK